MIGEISSRSRSPGSPGQHREAAVLAAARRRRRRPTSGGSSSETNSPPTTSAMRWVPISDVAMAASLSLGGCRGVAHRHRQTHAGPSSRSAAIVQLGLDRRRVRTSRPPSTRLDVSALGDLDRQGVAAARVRVSNGPNDSSHSTASSQRDPRLHAAGQFVDGLETRRRRHRVRRGGAAAAGSAHDETVEFAVAVDQELRRQRVVLADARIGGARWPEHAELPTGSGSCSRSRGRDTAGSPRRAPRRRWRAPGPRCFAGSSDRPRARGASASSVVTASSKSSMPRADL